MQAAVASKNAAALAKALTAASAMGLDKAPSALLRPRRRRLLDAQAKAVDMTRDGGG